MKLRNSKLAIALIITLSWISSSFVQKENFPELVLAVQQGTSISNSTLILNHYGGLFTEVRINKGRAKKKSYSFEMEKNIYPKYESLTEFIRRNDITRHQPGRVENQSFGGRWNTKITLSLDGVSNCFTVLECYDAVLDSLLVLTNELLPKHTKFSLHKNQFDLCE